MKKNKLESKKNTKDIVIIEDKKISKNKGGRPPLNLDKNQILELAKIHCTMKEIAAVMGCSVDTLENRFSDIIKEVKEIGKTSLRRYMWKAVSNGSVSMMIWLSKQLLGMREPQVIEVVRDESKGVFNEWYDATTKV